MDFLAESEPLKTIAEALGEDANLHLVGGTVRDLLTNASHYDLDLATKLKPEEYGRRLEAAGLRCIDTGIAHGTVTVLTEAGQAELTTFRVPGPRLTGAFSDTIQEDLSGRDFTINAMAYDLRNRRLLDPFGGRDDLAARLVRAVASPEDRFLEDPLRMLRMIRFGPAQGRTIEPLTSGAAARLAEKIASVSQERIRTELERIINSPHPAAAFQALLENGLLAFILPEMLPAVGFEQNEFHVHDVFHHTLEVMERCPPGDLRIAAVFHDLGKPHTLSTDAEGRRHFYRHEEVSTELCKQAMKRLRFSNQLIAKISTLVRYHMRPITCGAPGVRRLMRDLGEHLPDWLIFKGADKPPVMPDEDFQAELVAFTRLLEAERIRAAGPSYGKLAVTGDDLIALGIQPGPFLGNVLKALHELVIDDPESNQRENLLQHARRMLEERDARPST